jgi:hypothetical protein
MLKKSITAVKYCDFSRIFLVKGVDGTWVEPDSIARILESIRLRRIMILTMINLRYQNALYVSILQS